MQATCMKSNLNTGLATIGRVVPARSTLPILSHLLIAVEPDQIRVGATNLEYSIVRWIQAHSQTLGEFTIPARNFIDLVNSLPDDQVELKLNEGMQSIGLKCSTVKSTFRGIVADEYPMLPSRDNGGIPINAKELAAGLSQVVFAASDDDGHPVLGTVLAEFGGDTLTLSAADGFRLSRCSIALANQVTEPWSVLIPKKAVLEVIRITRGLSGDVAVFRPRSQNQIIFETADTVLNSQLMDGNYPQVERIIPSSHRTSVTVSRDALLQACRRAAIFARDVADIVRFDVSANLLTIEADGLESGQGETELDCVTDGPSLLIAFNGRFMIDVLAVLDLPEVTLEFNLATQPGVVKAVGNDRFVHVVMPMHIAPSNGSSDGKTE